MQINLYKQVHDISIKILHTHNKQDRKVLKNQLAELRQQLPEKPITELEDYEQEQEGA